MSTPGSYTPTGERGSGGFSEADYGDDRGQGLVTFAGVMLAIAATLNCLYGIAAIDNAHFFVHGAKYVFGDLNTWGWFVLLFGVARAGAGGWASGARAPTRSSRRSGSPPIRSSR
jgi:hypothetical protein